MPETKKSTTVEVDEPSPPSAKRKWLMRLLAIGFAMGLSVPAAEITLRLLRESDRFYPYHRSAKRVFYPSEKTTPGIAGESYFTTNSLGARGPELDDSKYRMLVIGGSTAACTALNDDETWPFLLARDVNEREGSKKTLWVTNSGIDGLNSRHHLMHAKYFVPRVPDLDYVLVYAGLNDVGLWLYGKTFDEHYLDDPDNWARTVAESFRVSNYTSPEMPWYKHLELWKSASIVKAYFKTAKFAKQQQAGVYVQDERFEWMEKAAKQRADQRKSFVHQAKMDTLDTALASYRSNLSNIVTECRSYGAEPILMAQYIMWYDISEDQRKRIWMGAMDGGESYIREEQMAELLSKFNLAMKQVADESNVLFVDLPAMLEGQQSICYDGCHFNEKGARVAADKIANLFIKTRLFETKQSEPN